MKMRYILPLLLLLLLLLTANAWGATYYVSATGAGDNSGDSAVNAMPQSVADDQDTFTAGDLVYLLDDGGDFGTWTWRSTGATGNPIILQVMGGENVTFSPGVNAWGFYVSGVSGFEYLTINGNGGLFITGISEGYAGVWIREAAEVEINNVEIYGGGADVNNTGIWIDGVGSDNAKVYNSVIYDFHVGILLEETSGEAAACNPPTPTLLDGNIIYDCYRGDTNSADCIAFNLDDVVCDYSGTIISNCDISSFADNGIDTIGGENIVIDTVTIHDPIGSAAGAGTGMKLENNNGFNNAITVKNSLIAHMRAGGEQAGVQGYGVELTLLNTTIHDTGNSSVTIDSAAGADSRTFLNNIFSSANHRGLANAACLRVTAASILDINNNDYYGCGANVGRVDGANKTTWSAYTTALSGVGGDEANGVEADPKFTNESGSTFRDFMPRKAMTGTDVSLTTDGLGLNIVGAPPIGAVDSGFLRTPLGD